jgi:ribosomal protein L33
MVFPASIGVGKAYIPSLKVHDIPSKGRVNRIRGWKTQRVHQFLSDLESKVFYLLEWPDIVTDIREQFPLNQDITLKIANIMGVKHPQQKGIPILMTTDFVITLGCGRDQYNVARSVKYSRDLNNKRTIEKLELEKRYWNTQGIDWALITENEISETLYKNIKAIHQSKETDFSKAELDPLIQGIIKTLPNYPKFKLSQYGQLFDKEKGLEKGTTLNVLHYLIANKKISPDWAEKKLSLLKLEDLDYSLPFKMIKSA